MADNAATEAADWAVTQQINLARVEAGSVNKVTAILEDLEGEITKILNTRKLSIRKQQKLREIQTAANKAIGRSYDQIKKLQQADLFGVAKVTNKGVAKQVNQGITVNLMDPVLSNKQLEKLADDTLIFGAKSREWWNGQDKGLRDRFAREMRMGYSLGESVEELQRRVRGTKENDFKDGIMQTSKREAEALVRTSVQTVSNEAKLASFEEMEGLVKQIQWISVLDSRTTHICMSLDKLTWSLPDYKPVGHSKDFPGAIAHWGCRSTQIPVTASWSELSGKPVKALDNKELQTAVDEKLRRQGMSEEKIKQAKVRSRASMDGQVAENQNYNQWLKTKSPEFVRETLGPSRAALWQSGQLQLKDLTDQSNRTLTVAQLEESIDADELPPETEGVATVTVALSAFDQSVRAEDLVFRDDQAQERIDAILNAGKGQSALARAIRRLQRQEPDLSPMELLAKAEGLVGA